MLPPAVRAFLILNAALGRKGAATFSTNVPLVMWAYTAG